MSKSTSRTKELEKRIEQLENELATLKSIDKDDSATNPFGDFFNNADTIAFATGFVFDRNRLSVLDIKGRLLYNINKLVPAPRDLLTYFLLNIPLPERKNLYRKWIASVTRKNTFECIIPYINREKQKIHLSILCRLANSPNDTTQLQACVVELPNHIPHHYEFKERMALLDALIYNIPFGFWAFDINEQCYMQNKMSSDQWGNMLGKSLSYIKGTCKQQPFPNSHGFNEFINGTKFEFEQEFIDQHGKRIYFHSVISPVVINGQKKGLLIFNIDISERKLFEKALQESERKFRNIFNNSTDGILIHDFHGNIYDYNNEFQNISGRTHRDLLTSINFFDLCQEDHQSEIRKGIANLVNGDQVFEHETEIVDVVGISLPVEVKSRVIEYLDSQSVLTIVRNIAFRKRFEIKLLNTVVETEERERERLAGDLHDEIGPLLSSMKMYLSLLKDTNEDAKKQYISSQVMDLVKQAITSIREVSNSLSPHILQNYGINAAIQNTLEKTRDLISVNFSTDCESTRFPGNYEIVFYRIFKELLNNTLKHARANHVEISLSFKTNMLILHYEDDGVGFNVTEHLSEKKSGLGLFNILSRVKAINGDYKIDSKNGSGFVFDLHAKINSIAKEL